MMPPSQSGGIGREGAAGGRFCRGTTLAWRWLPLSVRVAMPFSVQLFVLLYSAATGFVVAGLAGSLYQLVTAEPARFALLGPTAPAMLFTFLFCAVTGPFIIMRNALAGRGKERLAIGWLLGSATIAGLWSTCSGLLVLDFALAARATLG